MSFDEDHVEKISTKEKKATLDEETFIKKIQRWTLLRG